MGLRGRVDSFTAKKRAEEEAAKKKAEEDAKKKLEDEKKKADDNRKTEVKSNIGPPDKKLKVADNGEKDTNCHITMDVIKSRNQEFDQKLNEIERRSKELRYGAQLELLFTF